MILSKNCIKIYKHNIKINITNKIQQDYKSKQYDKQLAQVQA